MRKRHNCWRISFAIQINHGVVNSDFIKSKNILYTVSEDPLQDEFHKLRFLKIVCSLDYSPAETAWKEPVDLFIVFYYTLFNHIIIKESPLKNQNVMGVNMLLPDTHSLF